VGFEQNRTSVHQVLAVRPEAGGASAMAPTRSGIEVTAKVPSES
jgi:hypothetical protein